MSKKVRLTYEIVTEESAQHGDFANHGFVPRTLTITRRNNMPQKPALFALRDAINFLLEREGEGPVEADSSHISRFNPPRWFSYGGTFDPELNGHLRISLHLPDGITGSSAIRIARILKCYGIRNPVEVL